MATPYTNIYDKVTKTLQSYTFANLPQATFESFLDTWIDEACAVNFLDSNVDLLDRDEITKQFNETLSSREQWIIAYSVTLSWLSFMITDESALRDKIGDRDYQVHSPANLLGKLLDLHAVIKEKLEDAVEHYGYEGFSFIEYF